MPSARSSQASIFTSSGDDPATAVYVSSIVQSETGHRVTMGFELTYFTQPILANRAPGSYTFALVKTRDLNAYLEGASRPRAQTTQELLIRNLMGARRSSALFASDSVLVPVVTHTADLTSAISNDSVSRSNRDPAKYFRPTTVVASKDAPTPRDRSFVSVSSPIPLASSIAASDVQSEASEDAFTVKQLKDKGKVKPQFGGKSLEDGSVKTAGTLQAGSPSPVGNGPSTLSQVDQSQREPATLRYEGLVQTEAVETVAVVNMTGDFSFEYQFTDAEPALDVTAILVPREPEVINRQTLGSIVFTKRLIIRPEAAADDFVQVQPPRAELIFDSSGLSVSLTNANEFSCTAFVRAEFYLYGASTDEPLESREESTRISANDELVLSVGEVPPNTVALVTAHLESGEQLSEMVFLEGSVKESTVVSGQQVAPDPFSNTRLVAFLNSDELQVQIDLIGTADTSRFASIIRECLGTGTTVISSEIVKTVSVPVGGFSITARDTSELQHDYKYRYKLKDDLTGITLGSSSIVLYRNPRLFPSQVATLQTERLDSNDPTVDRFNVAIDLSFTTIEQVLSSLNNATEGQVKTSNGNVQIGNFIDNIQTNRDKFVDLFRVNIIRQDLSTGEEYDLGNFPAGEVNIDSKLLIANGVPTPPTNRRYVFRLLQRNALTVFNDIVETITDETSRTTFTKKVSKFLSPLNLIDDKIPSSDRVRVKDPIKASRTQFVDEFQLGYTGLNKDISVSASKQKSTFRLTASAASVNGKLCNVSWTVDGDASDIFGYWVSIRSGGKSTDLKMLPAKGAGTFVFKDAYGPNFVGPKEYVITAVNKSLEPVMEAITNRIVTEKTTLSKDTKPESKF